MKNIKIKKDAKVDLKFQTYPDEIKPKLEHLRNLIIEVATEIDSIAEIEETFKWGELKTPNQYAIYFKCTSKLVPTFKEVFGNLFKYENNRAILFDLNDQIPEKELKTCIDLALKYHSVKNLPLLGI